MAILNCKMCGGELNITSGTSVCECEYCGSKQTVPSVDDEKKVKLYARANDLRASCDFDRAYGVYESIVNEFPKEAEAYFGLILCKYGIEYVDDPKTGKKIPTCHRSSFESILDDKDFDMVMECSDSEARAVYREQAKEIEEIRKKIIELSSKQEIYDIFICYKESDDKGERTIDSVLAQDIYTVLTKEGYKVFFAKITLESKLGSDYEPIIFSALHSARVMLAIGTTYDYYHAVWVRNEWSRYLKMIAAGEEKTLIPCFKDMDAYDIPKEFRHLQAQDMGKVGATQDLLRGIEKILKQTNSPSTNADTPTDESTKEANELDKLILALNNAPFSSIWCDQVENARQKVSAASSDVKIKLKNVPLLDKMILKVKNEKEKEQRRLSKERSKKEKEVRSKERHSRKSKNNNTFFGKSSSPKPKKNKQINIFSNTSSKYIIILISAVLVISLGIIFNATRHWTLGILLLAGISAAWFFIEKKMKEDYLNWHMFSCIILMLISAIISFKGKTANIYSLFLSLSVFVSCSYFLFKASKTTLQDNENKRAQIQHNYNLLYFNANLFCIFPLLTLYSPYCSTYVRYTSILGFSLVVFRILLTIVDRLIILDKEFSDGMFSNRRQEIDAPKIATSIVMLMALTIKLSNIPYGDGPPYIAMFMIVAAIVDIFLFKNIKQKK